MCVCVFVICWEQNHLLFEKIIICLFMKDWIRALWLWLEYVQSISWLSRLMFFELILHNLKFTCRRKQFYIDDENHHVEYGDSEALVTYN